MAKKTPPKKAAKKQGDEPPNNRGGAREGAGAPLKEIDWDKIKRACEFCATCEEAAYLAGVSVDTITRRLAENGTTWAAFFKEHSASSRLSLRMWQFQNAKNGNVAMQIWLGKNILDQKDRTEIGFDPEKPVKFRLSMGKKLEKEAEE